MKVLVIGIDALEYNLVEEWNLGHIKQEEHGKVKVPILSSVGVPMTPQVWASFLTGEIKDKKFEYISPFMRLLVKANEYFKPRLGFYTFFSKFLSHSTRFPKLKEKTFLDHVYSEYYNVPYYDFSERYCNEIVSTGLDFRGGKLGYREMKEFLRGMFNKDREESIKRIKKVKADLFFCYFFSLDYLQHHFYKDKELIRKSYEEFDTLLRELKKIGKPEFCLVVSDHGARDGNHTGYGFYSINKKLDLKMPHITDFYDLIMNELNLPTRKEEIEIKKTLEGLGYL